MYPYNIQQLNQKKTAEKVEHENSEKQNPQAPRDNAEFREKKSFSGNEHKQAIDYSPDKTINIKNVVEDFQKTLAAIDAPKEINEEVKTYLKLVDNQSLKTKPSSRLIRSNLVNAAGILDEYITETLKKPSKVVTGWIEALLMQKIDYKADPSLSNTEETAKNNTLISEKITANEILPEISPLSPENKKLESLYKKAEKLTDIGDFPKAIKTYNKILPEVKKVQDKKLETKIYLDKAYVYDANKNYSLALENYNLAASLAKETGNDKIRAITHYNMASIYDEFGLVTPALNHYYEALSLDGQIENLRAQSHTLNDVGNIFSSTKKYKAALDHYSVGVSLTKETKDFKGRAFLYSNIASVFKDTKKDSKALNFYKKSIECDIKTGNLEGFSLNYEHSGDIMSRNNLPAKAQKFYKKSLIAAKELGDSDMYLRILDKLSQNSISY